MLFKFLEEKMREREFITNNLDEKNYSFSKKIRRSTINIEITDTDRENFLEINAYNPKRNLFGEVPNWSNKQIFGLKYSLWIVLLIVAISIVPLIVFLGIKESISQEAQIALRIGGIILVSIGGVVFIGYLIFTRISLGSQEEIYDQVSELVQEIIYLIEGYKEETLGKRVCWSCFKEIETETQKCPHCGIDL